ncbi:Hypothetical protein mma_1104 [Janthinobacterium sp. Marseille]|nr:PilZ domain-containing protein [Janthinobacterium sp. Marseille]ABR91320.1 Hypothetical protein mma_1104 [Janthinobacterium sp. Marseille]
MQTLTHPGECVFMNAHGALPNPEPRRKEQRFVFRRRGLMTRGATTTQIHTVDVSTQGMGVMGPEPVRTGEVCAIMLDALVGGRMMQLKFTGKAVDCTLAGIQGFRTSLYIDGSVEAHQLQLQKIIATCSTTMRDLG